MSPGEWRRLCKSSRAPPLCYQHASWSALRASQPCPAGHCWGGTASCRGITNDLNTIPSFLISAQNLTTYKVPSLIKSICSPTSAVRHLQSIEGGMRHREVGWVAKHPTHWGCESWDSDLEHWAKSFRGKGGRTALWTRVQEAGSPQEHPVLSLEINRKFRGKKETWLFLGQNCIFTSLAPSKQSFLLAGCTGLPHFAYKDHPLKKMNLLVPTYSFGQKCKFTCHCGQRRQEGRQGHCILQFTSKDGWHLSLFFFIIKESSQDCLCWLLGEETFSSI